MRVILLLAFLALVASVSVRPPSMIGRTQIASRLHNGVRNWSPIKVAQPSDKIEFTIFLKQKNLDQLEALFEAVSDPDNSKWGQFLSKKELDDLVRPDQEVYEQFDQWLKPFTTTGALKVIKHADCIQISTTVSVASQLLQVPFHIFKHSKSGKTLIRAKGTVTVPQPLSKNILLIAGLTELFEGPIKSEYKRQRMSAGTSGVKDIIITPDVLKQFYNVPSDLKVTNPGNLQAIAAFDDEFSQGALAMFDQKEGIDPANVTRVGPDCAPDCDQYESDLDVQYITAMAQGIDTLFIAQGQNYWILQTVTELLNSLPQHPYVISFSYGWGELAQCDIAVSNCPKLGYNSQQYVQATNVAFQKLGVLGLSAFVSDGDDGAPGLGGAFGNCPQDPNNYCPTTGCSHKTSSCAQFTVVDSNGDTCIFPMGLGGDNCSLMLQDNDFQNALYSWLGANRKCKANLEMDRDQLPHVYSTCDCSSMSYGTYSGYTFSAYTYSPKTGPAFTADYPTSSPFVTSVGATQFIGSDISSVEEVGASILSGAMITTGGGFSSFQAMPSYQKAAVAAYLQNSQATIPPTTTFNSSMRGYPDISFNGHNYMIYVSSDGGDNCPCGSGQVDGTSASSPTFAGLVTLMNDALLNAGLQPIGFMNPLLYKMYTEAPNAFNDISKSSNNCNRAYCCQYGFSAAPGTWDPVTGLGSPNFGNMLSYIMNKKMEHKQKYGY